MGAHKNRYADLVRATLTGRVSCMRIPGGWIIVHGHREIGMGASKNTAWNNAWMWCCRTKQPLKVSIEDVPLYYLRYYQGLEKPPARAYSIVDGKLHINGKEAPVVEVERTPIQKRRASYQKGFEDHKPKKYRGRLNPQTKKERE
jgi:hypothetical protein